MPKRSVPKIKSAPICCAFCFANEDERADLVRHGNIAICDTCIDLSYEIVTKARGQRAARVTA